MPKRLKQVKTNFHSVDTSRAKKQPGYKKPKDLEVEKSINKSKEVKEKDVFDFNHKK